MKAIAAAVLALAAAVLALAVPKAKMADWYPVIALLWTAAAVGFMITGQ